MKTYSWKIQSESITQEIILSEQGNTYVGTMANSIRAYNQKIFREHNMEDTVANWEYMLDRFIVPALSKKIGVTILTEVN